MSSYSPSVPSQRHWTARPRAGTSRESRPSMRLLAVEQLRKIENDALEVNIVSFLACVYTGELVFFCHAWLIHVTFEQIQSGVYMSPCRGGAFLE